MNFEDYEFKERPKFEAFAEAIANILEAAIRDDPAYRLRGGKVVSLSVESPGLLVKPDVARRQIDAETPSAAPNGTPNGNTGAGTTGVPGPAKSGATVAAPNVTEAPRPHRFHGTVQLDPTRVGRDASRIADEVISHLAGQVGARVTVTLEIEASLPDGATDHIVRTVTENSRALKFTSQGFEAE